MLENMKIKLADHVRARCIAKLKPIKINQRADRKFLMFLGQVIIIDLLTIPCYGNRSLYHYHQ
jgi:hypothetical protein